MTKRGTVLRDTNIGPGLLTVDGTQYTFLLEGMWKSEVPPRTGMRVDVNFDQDGAPAAVYAVSDSQLVREQSRHAPAGPLPAERGTIRSPRQMAFRAAAILCEAVLLVAFFVLPDCRMTGSLGSRPVTGWDAIVLIPMSQMTTHQGLPGLLAVVCLLAPIASLLMKQGWSRWLNAAPFVFAVAAFLTLGGQIGGASLPGQTMGEALTRSPGQEMFRQSLPPLHIEAGGYIALSCSLYLLTRVFSRTTP